MTLLDLALGYNAGGISLVPCSHVDKRPEARLLPGGKWKPYQTVPADEATVRGWFAAGCKSIAGIGGAVSGGLLIIDFDEARFYDAWKAYAGSVAHDLPTQRTGREGGGYQVWLRCERPGGSEKLAWVKDNNEETGRRCAVETKGEGGYAIMPGSLHPSGRLYEAISGDFSAIPVIRQDLVDVLLNAARELDEAPQTRQQTEKSASSYPQTGDSVIDEYNRETNIEATLSTYGYTDAGGGRWKRPGGKSGSVGVVEGRSFHHSANDPLNDGYWHSAFDVFCKLEHGGDCTAAVRAVADRFKAVQEPADLSYIVPCDPESNTPAAPLAFPSDCLRPPGLISDIIEYNLRTALWPQPELALAAAIALVGTITGRKIEDPRRTRTNVYVLGLAASGSGKEHARSVTKEILFRAGGEKLIGPERIASSAGLVKFVESQPAILFQLDEIGRLLETMRDPKRAPHLFNIGTVLMAIEGNSHNLWIGDAYANQKQTPKINQPHACLYGTAVPAGFWENLTEANVSEGLLGRMFVFESAKRYVDIQTPERLEIPESILNAVRWWLAYKPGGNLDEVNPTPMTAVWGRGAEQRMDDHLRGICRQRAKEDDVRAALWSRTTGKTAKLALIFACSREVGAVPVTITVDDMNRAIQVSNWLTRRTLYQAFRHVSSNEREAKSKRILRIISDSITRSELTRKTQWICRRERDELVAELIESGYISVDKSDTKGRPAEVFKLTRPSAKFLP